MSSENKFWPSKKRKPSTKNEVPIYHAQVGTEAHLRAMGLIAEGDDVTLEFTPTSVRIIKQGGV